MRTIELFQTLSGLVDPPGSGPREVPGTQAELTPRAATSQQVVDALKGSLVIAGPMLRARYLLAAAIVSPVASSLFTSAGYDAAGLASTRLPIEEVGNRRRAASCRNI